jgi:hypothetical protein
VRFEGGASVRGVHTTEMEGYILQRGFGLVEEKMEFGGLVEENRENDGARNSDLISSISCC